AGREDGVVGRRPIRIQVREAAGDDALAADALDGVARRSDHRLVERREALPGDGGLERLADHAEPDDGVAQVGCVQEGAAPCTRRSLACALAVAPRATGIRRYLPAVVAGALERPLHPGVESMVGGLEGQEQDR